MRKCALVCFLILLALGSTGAGYAMWDKPLYIDGTVNTGDVDAEWTYTSCSDEEYLLDDPKDVGSISAQIDADDSQKLHFTITNGYPCYTGDCQVEFVNAGSIPLRVQSVDFLPGNLTGCVFIEQWPSGSFTVVCDQLTVTWVNGVGVQLEPGEPNASSIRAHVEQDAEELSDYTFDVEVQLVQWNEYEP